MKINVKNEAPSMSPQNMSCLHNTTFEFGQTRPTYYAHLDPHDKISVDLNMLVRTSPLTYPAFGGAQFIHRGFFVPYRLICPQFDKFFKGINVNVNSVSKQVCLPTFTTQDILRLFTSVAIKQPNGVFGDNLFRQPYLDCSLGCSSTVYTDKFPTISVEPKCIVSPSTHLCENAFIIVNAVAWTSSSAPSSPYGDSFAYDFIYDVQSSDSIKTRCFARLKPYGRYCLKVLDSLGYQIGWSFVHATRFDVVRMADVALGFGFARCYCEPDYAQNPNGLALLSFVRLLFENYLPSQFASISDFTMLFNYLDTAEVYTDSDKMKMAKVAFGSAPYQYSILGLIFGKLLRFGFQLYSGSNYFSEAWYNQQSVINGVYASDDATLQNYQSQDYSRGVPSFVHNETTGTFFEDDGDSTVLASNASATGHKFLNGIYNWVMRSQLAGTRLGDILLSTFGITSKASKVDKCVYLGKKICELQIQDVTAMASTKSDGESVSTLGEYAGKAFAVTREGDKFEFQTDEWGIFIIVTSLVSDGFMCQGTDRMNLLLDNLDFYQPSLEKTGNQPVLVDEFMGAPSQTDPLFMETLPSTLHPNYRMGKIFGFLPRYSYRKFPRNWLTGDFRIKHLGGTETGELQAFHLMRLFLNPNIPQGTIDANGFASLTQVNTNPVAQGSMLYDNGAQYNRIFNVQDNLQDHFFATMYFDVKLITQKLPLRNSFDVDGFRDRLVEMNGNGDTKD